MSLDIINKLKPAKYTYNDTKPEIKDSRTNFGFSAQDVNNLFPKEEYAFVNTDEDGYLMVNYHQFIAPMVKAIQELSQKVETLEKQLKDKNETL